MTTQRAECKSCGFKQDKIYRWAYSGAMFHLKYACFKCKKIISYPGDLKKCPDCKSEVTLYSKSDKKGYYICPSRKKQKLKFHTESIS